MNELDLPQPWLGYVLLASVFVAGLVIGSTFI